MQGDVQKDALDCNSLWQPHLGFDCEDENKLYWEKLEKGVWC